VTPLRWLTLTAGYGVGRQHLPAALNPAGTNTAPRDDVLQTCELTAAAQPLAWLELFARYSLVWSSSNMPGGQYHRNQVLVGAGARWDFVRLRTARAPLAPEVRGAGVTFHHRAPPGHRVAVIGDWNGWAPQPLDEVGGVYSGTVVVPRGRHEYAFTVDGQVVSPPDAAALVADGFGGKNGVLTVE
jgi:Glycogen recognition site of AMP-activated protein kinase